MHHRKLARSLAFVAWLPLAASACGGAAFDDPSEIKGLRIVAVQKNPPYPKPGQDVDIKLVFWDGKGSEDNPRNIRVDFSPFPCENPKGDLYYNCFASLGGTPSAGPVPNELDAPPALQDIDHVREKKVHIGEDIISSRPQIPGVTPYGLSFTLFTACAGHLGQVPNAGPNTLPLGCFDDSDNHQLGADDFVVGYTSLYVYNDRINNNPVVNDFLFEGASLKDSTTAADADVRHVPRCTASDRTSCPKYAIKVALDRTTTVDKDDDPTATTPDGKQLDEQVWLAYYITRGELKNTLRLVNDATAGWNEQNGTEYTAPAEPGPVRIFGVLHDNRGGVDWAEGKIIVE